jgi:hypothetical protein
MLEERRCELDLTNTSIFLSTHLDFDRPESTKENLLESSSKEYTQKGCKVPQDLFARFQVPRHLHQLSLVDVPLAIQLTMALPVDLLICTAAE